MGTEDPMMKLERAILYGNMDLKFIADMKLEHATLDFSGEHDKIGEVKDKKLDDESFSMTATIDKKLMRKIFGLPDKPLSKPKRSRKTFKKLIMAYGYSRNKAEQYCDLIACINGSYKMHSELMIRAKEMEIN